MQADDTLHPARDAAAHLLRLLSVIERGLCVAAFALLVAVLFADVVSRELTSAGLHWASQIGVWANVVVVMAGFGLASAAGAHLRPRFADHWLPVAWQPRIITLQHGLMAMFCTAIGALSLAVVIGSWRLGEVEIALFLPVWPVQAMLPLAFFTGALRHTIYAAWPPLRPSESGAFDLGERSQ